MSEVVRVGMRTPWGTADSARVLADGIGEVGTPGHGGIKLSAARNRQVPTALRRDGGWYEEDCDVAIPLYLFHAELQPRSTPGELWDIMRRWYPEQVDAAYPAGRAEALAERLTGVSLVKDTVADPDRRAQDTTRADDEPYEAPDVQDGDRCHTCRGHGVVRCSGKHYRTTARAQEARDDGRAVMCPTCEGAALVDSRAALLQAAQESGHLQVVTVGR